MLNGGLRPELLYCRGIIALFKGSLVQSLSLCKLVTELSREVYRAVNVVAKKLSA
jgi:hypothetical protein